VRIDVNKKLTRFVSVTKDKQKEWYQVKYEKCRSFATIVVILGTGMRSVETASTMSRALNGGSSFWLEVVEVRVEEEEEVAVFRDVLRSW
jgi:hypothetical protein